MTPQRIQRKRTKGWRTPPNTVYVGRPSKWGNPFTINPDDPLSHAAIAQWFRQWLDGELPEFIDRRNRILVDLHELRGKNLAFWCPLDKPCHADVLLKLANEG